MSSAGRGTPVEYKILKQFFGVLEQRSDSQLALGFSWHLEVLSQALLDTKGMFLYV